MRYLKIVPLVLALSFLQGCAPTESLPPNALDPAKVERFIHIASEMTRYEIPRTRPVVLVMPSGFLPAGALGMFDIDDPRYILVSADTPRELQETVLVHEYVHYLQWAAGVIPKNQTCEQRAFIEAEAYVASYRFELKYLPFNHGLDVTRSNCPS